MTIIYVVTHGEYSSYGISGVYSTEEKARAAAGEHGVVEYYPLDEDCTGYAPWYVEMERDGTTTRRVFIDPTPSATGWLFRTFKGHRTIVVTVWAHNREQAIKAANEKRAQTLALGMWDDPEPQHFAAVYLPR
jgi:hypothetical protein